MGKDFKFVDLFCGCGGFSLGMQQAGMQLILGVDYNEPALETFKWNFPDAMALNKDLHLEDDFLDVVSALEGKKIDLLIAGPPCQGFSLTGTRNERDKRNTLFYRVFDIAKIIKPKAFIIENVPGIARLYGGKVKSEIFRLSKELGYNCTHQEVYAPEYGVPQIRKRAFFVSIKSDYGEFSFPIPTRSKENFVTCHEAIGDLPSLLDGEWSEKMTYEKEPFSEYQKLMRNESKCVLNHIGTNHTPHVVNVISQVPEGGNHKDLPPGVGDSRKFNEAWTRYHSKRPSKTIDTGHRNHFHYKYNRVPTVRENARLQSFPDHFIFRGNKSEQYRQVGNAVPPLLAKAIGEVLINRL